MFIFEAGYLDTGICIFNFVVDLQRHLNSSAFNTMWNEYLPIQCFYRSLLPSLPLPQNLVPLQLVTPPLHSWI